MIAKLRTVGLSGLQAVPIDIEITRGDGKPLFSIIGLGDSAVKEAKERVLAALALNGFKAPPQVLVNLAPAELRKEGSSFDLAIALGILVCEGYLPASALYGRCFLGELGLDGRVKAIKGALTLCLAADSSWCKEIFVPKINLPEARLLTRSEVKGVNSITELLSYLKGGELGEQDAPQAAVADGKKLSFGDVWGQEVAKRALTIAAAGAHNLLLVGPPGCGKSMLAERCAHLLPTMSEEEVIELASIYSALGEPFENVLRGQRPFRAPHHSISDAGLIGGGANVRPGEITLSHRGVLFLDEFPEFRRSALEALRAPLEAGRVSVSRAKCSRMFPAAFQLLAAMNPCPCGKYGYNRGKSVCTCSVTQIQKYLAKISGPIIERVDLQVELEPVPLHVLTAGFGNHEGEGMLDYSALITRTVAIQKERQHMLNSRLPSDILAATCAMENKTKRFFEESCRVLNVSARSFMRLLRVARTIADVDQAEKVEESHLAEALSYRALSRIKENLQVPNEAIRR